MKTFLLILTVFFAMNGSLFANNPNQKVIILLGPPGSGKGTQAAFLTKKTGLTHISTGDLFRENLAGNTLVGQKAKSYMEKGALVPDEVVLEMLSERLKKDDTKKGFILDGVPRTINQAEQLDKMLEKSKVIVINLDVPDNLIIKRLSERLSCEKCSAPYNVTAAPPKVAGICDRCGGKLIQRKDDQEEVIKKRLAVYHEQTEPVTEYYKRKGNLHRIDGSSSKEAITEQIEAVLKNF